MRLQRVSPSPRFRWLRLAAAWVVVPGCILALSLPLEAQARPALVSPTARNIAELRKKIEADHRTNPTASVRWAEEALGLLATEKDGKTEAAILTMLVRDLGTLSEYDRAAPYLARARRLVAATKDERDHFFLEVEAAALASNQEDNEEVITAMGVLLPPMEAYRSREPRDIAFASLLARGYRILGGACRNLGRPQEAILAYTKGQKVCDAVGDRRGHARILDQIGSLYSQLGRNQEAVASHLAAIAIAEALDNVQLQAACRMSYAKTLGIMNATDAELEQLTKASKLAVKAQDPDTQSICTVNLADVYLRKKDYKATLAYAEAALKMSLAANNLTSIAVCKVNRGIALNRLGRGAEGLKSIQEGLAHFKATQVLGDLTEITGNLAEEYAFSGDFRNAYETERQFKALSDSLKKSEDLKRIAEASAAFNNDKRQIELEALQRDQASRTKLRGLWIALGALGFMTLGVLILGRRKLQLANKALADQSMKDPLTTLGNRRYLTTRIAEDLAQVIRLQNDTPAARARLVLNIDVTFLMIDIDHFKEVNDRFGHAAGDRVIQQFAEILSRAMRDSDTVVRWGGEEFLVVAKPTSHRDAHLVAERIRSRVEAFSFDLGDGQGLQLTCSIGFSSYPFYRAHPSQLAWERVTEVADRCLYAAKSMGRNTWVGVHEAVAGAATTPEDIQGGLDVPELVRRGVLEAISRSDEPVVWS